MAVTHAQMRRKEAYDAVRKKIKGANLITAIGKNMAELESLKAIVKKAKSTEDNPLKVKNAIEKADCITRTTKVQIDTRLRMLKFVVPELKSVELTDPNGDNPLGQLADALRNAVSGSGT